MRNLIQYVLMFIWQSRIPQSEVQNFSPCPAGWIYSQTSGSCFRQLDAPFNFAEAPRSCREFGNTSELLQIDEENEDEELFLAFWQFHSGISWIGLQIEDSKLKWLNGAAVPELS